MGPWDLWPLESDGVGDTRRRDNAALERERRLRVSGEASLERLTFRTC